MGLYSHGPTHGLNLELSGHGSLSPSLPHSPPLSLPNTFFLSPSLPPLTFSLSLSALTQGSPRRRGVGGAVWPALTGPALSDTP